MTEEENKIGAPEEDRAGENSTPDAAASDRRLVCYFALFMALVFVVNAMETGSYRTPWPVAILCSAGALFLCFRLRGPRKA
jgi:hypothetical protein